MFDIGFWELCLIGVIALLILGPERLPKVARTAGFWAGRARRFMAEVKSDIDAEIRRDEIESLRQVGDDIKRVQRDVESAGRDIDRDVAAADEAIAGAVNAQHKSAASGESDSAASEPTTGSGKS
jgi:sec-independent protein translocase protein TatB